MSYFLKIGKRPAIAVKDLRTASVVYRLRQGAKSYHNCPVGIVIDLEGQIVGHVSYNGRIWRGEPEDWFEGKQPLYDPKPDYPKS
jgi:hypothetical protein